MRRCSTAWCSAKYKLIKIFFIYFKLYESLQKHIANFLGFLEEISIWCVHLVDAKLAGLAFSVSKRLFFSSQCVSKSLHNRRKAHSNLSLKTFQEGPGEDFSIPLPSLQSPSKVQGLRVRFYIKMEIPFIPIFVLLPSQIKHNKYQL